MSMGAQEGTIERVVDPKGIEHYPLFAAAFLDDMVGDR